jgi:CheY-like chemotaxis protein
MRVLIVDDDPLAAAMTEAVLGDAGHEAVIAENAVEAMEKLSENGPFALIVSDMNMPLASGIDLFRSLREQGIRTPFLLLTGDEPAVILSHEPGLDGAIRKDETLETTLIEAVERIVTGK